MTSRRPRTTETTETTETTGATGATGAAGAAEVGGAGRAARAAAVANGVTGFDNAADAVTGADVVITMLPNGELVKRCYAEVLPAGSAAVMVGHLDVPGLTDGLPTSLTPATYRLLRDDYGFDGLVVTDDLGAMKAVTRTFALPEAVLAALAAGADAGLWSSGPGAGGSGPAGPAGPSAAQITPVLDLLEKALADGRLDPAANDRAVARVLTAKGVC